MKRDHVWCGDFHEVFGMVSWDSRGKAVTETGVVTVCECEKSALGSLRAHGVGIFIKSFKIVTIYAHKLR